MSPYLCLLVVGLLLKGLQCAEWSKDSLQDDAVVYACAGGSVSLPWKFVLPASGETLKDIQWFFNGRSSELIAIHSHGAFAVLPAYSQRVKETTPGGIELSNVTRADEGNFSVEVSGHADNGSFFSLRRSASLKVADGLSTEDGELHVIQSPVAVMDPVTDQWSLQLLCGRFIYPQHAPFTAEWLTPSGAVHPSTSYEDNYFRLLVPRPATGTYTCRVPLHSACLHSNGPHQGSAALALNGLEARLSLLEAGQAALQAKNNALEQEVTSLRGENDNLKALVAAETGSGEGGPLNSSVSVLRSRVEKLEATATTHVYFHANGLDNRHASINTTDDPLKVGTQLTLNVGRGYDPATGLFTAPVSGTYLFLGTSGTRPGVFSLAFDLSVGPPRNVKLAKSEVKGEEVSGTVSGVVHLQRGNTVFLRSYVAAGFPVFSEHTTFSGVLLSADP